MLSRFANLSRFGRGAGRLLTTEMMPAQGQLASFSHKGQGLPIPEDPLDELWIQWAKEAKEAKKDTKKEIEENNKKETNKGVEDVDKAERDDMLYWLQTRRDGM